MKTLHVVFCDSVHSVLSGLRTFPELLKYFAEVKVPRSSAYHQNTRFLVGHALEALCAFFCYLDKQMPLKT